MFQLVPIFLKEDDVDSFLMFHELLLRPLFHNFKSLNEFEFD
jgi:hypothetical protein